MVGATMVVGAAMASVSASPDPEPSPDTTADFPVIREKRRDAADDVSRRAAGKAIPKPASDGVASKVEVDRPRPQPKSTPKPAASPDPAPVGARMPPIPGCDAEVPSLGAVVNGELGDDHLCDLGNGHRLRPDAAAAFVALAEEYSHQTGGSLLECITDSYRSYDLQVELKLRKPYLAARPGTSNHGWGLAVDLGCGANVFGSPLHDWLEEVGDEYGWTNPDWAQPTGSKPEPWHWEWDSTLVD